MENDKIKINWRLLRKNRAIKQLKKAENNIINSISYKLCRSENQAAERRKKRKFKHSNIIIKPN